MFSLVQKKKRKKFHFSHLLCFYLFNTLAKNETIKYNDERVEKANDENEMWRIIKDISNPKTEQKWSLKEGDDFIVDEMVIAETFNDFFIQKLYSIIGTN